jgi:uncharacterized protein
MQFIPVVERINSDGQTLYQEGAIVSERSVLPEQFGRFLAPSSTSGCGMMWAAIFVQTFEAALSNWLGLASSGMCVFNETCGTGLAIEHNGDLYSCDHFVEPNYCWAISKRRICSSWWLRPAGEVWSDKRDTLPRYCRECDVRFACHGECPKNRFILTPDGEPGLNYLCAGFKAFLNPTFSSSGVMTSASPT